MTEADKQRRRDLIERTLAHWVALGKPPRPTAQPQTDKRPA